MPCSAPVKMFRDIATNKNGKRPLTYQPLHAQRDDFFNRVTQVIPCGKCIGCLLTRSRDWALRSVHEAKFHVESSFITLTYKPECLPAVYDEFGDLVGVGGFRPRDFTLFIKRLRKLLEPTGRKIKYRMVAEYGSQFKRPHYHALIFGWDAPDKVFHKNGKSGKPIYTSKILESLWYDEHTGESLGFSSVCDLTVQSANYVSRYCMKKTVSQLKANYYDRINPCNGEKFTVMPEFARTSLGIGAVWFHTHFMSDAYVKGYITENGLKYGIPRYYLKLLEKFHHIDFDFYKTLRDEAIKLIYSKKRPVDYENDGVYLSSVYDKLKREIDYE